jgi:excisionase family DNA binding protein
MSAPKDRPLVAPVPRLALNRSEAAASLGVSITTFDALVAPHVRMVRHGRLRLVPVSELERWIRENADLAIA